MKVYRLKNGMEATLIEIKRMLNRYSVDEIMMFRRELMDEELKHELYHYLRNRILYYCKETH